MQSYLRAKCKVMQRRLVLGGKIIQRTAYFNYGQEQSNKNEILFNIKRIEQLCIYPSSSICEQSVSYGVISHFRRTHYFKKSCMQILSNHLSTLHATEIPSKRLPLVGSFSSALLHPSIEYLQSQIRNLSFFLSGRKCSRRATTTHQKHTTVTTRTLTKLQSYYNYVTVHYIPVSLKRFFE